MSTFIEVQKAKVAAQESLLSVEKSLVEVSKVTSNVTDSVTVQLLGDIRLRLEEIHHDLGHLEDDLDAVTPELV